MLQMPLDLAHMHLERAKENEAFAASLREDDPTHFNWAVVVSFYAALHYAQAYLVQEKKACDKHPQRFQVLKTMQSFRRCYAAYQWLYTASEEARYHCTPVQATAERVRISLESVRVTIQPLMRSPGSYAAPIKIEDDGPRPTPGVPEPNR